MDYRSVSYLWIFRCRYQGDGNEILLSCPSFIFFVLNFSRSRYKLLAQRDSRTRFIILKGEHGLCLRTKCEKGYWGERNQEKNNYAKSYNKEICEISRSHYIAWEIKPRLKYAVHKRAIRNDRRSK